MTGYDFNPHFEKMWQYVNGTLAEDEYEKAIEYSKIGFATLELQIQEGQRDSVPRYLNQRSGVESSTYKTCCAWNHKTRYIGVDKQQCTAVV